MNKKNIYETERLILRPYTENDLNDLYEYLSDPQVVEYEPYKTMTMEEVSENLKWRISAKEMIAVELKATGKMIGNIYIEESEFNSMEIGYVFNRNYWRQGYAKEACNSVMNIFFSKGIHRIFAKCDKDNIASWSLLESLGMEREGYLKKDVYFWTDENGAPIWKDTYIYAKLNDQQR